MAEGVRKPERRRGRRISITFRPIASVAVSVYAFPALGYKPIGTDPLSIKSSQ